MSTLNAWDVIDANNNAAPPDGWPENTMSYSEVNDAGRAVQGTLKRFFADINGSLVAAGSANAYTLTLNETGYTAYFTGMYFACSIPATNTGASTLNVNAVGAVAIVDQSGAALSAGALQSGGVYEFRYDGTQFQLMGSLSGTATLQKGIFTNSNAPDLTDTDVAVNIGAADPTTAQHVEIGPSGAQSKSNSTTASAISINALGGDVSIGAQSGSGNTTLYRNSYKVFDGSFGGANFYGTSNADPTVPDVFTLNVSWYSADFNQYGVIGFGATTTFRMVNRAHGGNILLAGEDSSGTLNYILHADSDGAAALYSAGTRTFQTGSGGIVVFSDTSTDSENRRIVFEHQDNTVRGIIGYTASSILSFTNQIHGGTVALTGEKTAGTAVSLIEADPDADVALFDEGTEVARTLSAASGGWQINNTYSGSGWERALTVSDISSWVPTIVSKTSSTSRASTTTMTADPHLTLSIPAAGHYKIELYLLTQNAGSAAADIKVGLAWSGSVNDQRGYLAIGMDYLGAQIIQEGQFQSTPDALPFNSVYSSTQANLIRITGTFDANSSGTLALHWAQNSSDPSATQLLRHSFMEATLLTAI